MTQRTANPYTPVRFRAWPPLLLDGKVFSCSRDFFAAGGLHSGAPQNVGWIGTLFTLRGLGGAGSEGTALYDAGLEEQVEFRLERHLAQFRPRLTAQ